MVEDERTTFQRLVHALQSPLTVVLGSIEMLQSQFAGWPDEARELLQLAFSQAQRLQNTLEELLASAEVDGDTVRLSWKVAAAQKPAGEGKPPSGRETRGDNRQ